MFMLYGLTGGICTGKSLVAEMFKMHGATLIRTDDYLKGAYVDLKEEILCLFGDSILDTLGKIDRTELKKTMLEKMDLIETFWEIADSYLEPRIIPILEKEHNEITIFEAAQLYKREWNRYCKKVIEIQMPTKRQAEFLMDRAKRRDDFILTDEQALYVIEKQLQGNNGNPDHVINNEGSVSQLESEVAGLYVRIKNGDF
ncbi:hypothetical protein COV93_02690 [Candidatus Woesearchaeota archaeon CG11_big_fil_rev_8_21_14_0_20_43_8]|nr:MAG: hypothetical protein COV93_02690 [Candidatus Woesearchaeota archaeon CG11_big_fil_rev_8_21_14_0_20_43_8]PIO07089.1 MAG: hypothetical protein COT47_01545 [Candidatus Woesearchaeota archaeon CG08_land_8_20_14_0_20_43_7]